MPSMPNKTHHNLPADVQIGALSIAIDKTEGAFLQIFPEGEFDAPNGALLGAGPWRMSAVIAQSVIALAQRLKNDVLIDYEHQSLRTEKNGQPVPAAGWISRESLNYRAGLGLGAENPRWTDRARQMIEAGEYKYLSPVFTYHIETGEVIELLSVAITNQPAIDGMSPLTLAAASRLLTTHEEPFMDKLLEQLRSLLSLPAAASAAEVGIELARIEKQVAQGADGSKGLLAVLTAQSGQIAALTAQAAQPDPAKFAPIAALTAVQTELTQLRADIAHAEADTIIQAALSDGKLLPGQEQWARDLAAANLPALKTFLSVSAPIAALSGRQTGGKSPVGGVVKSDAQIAAAAREYHQKQVALGNNISYTAAVDAVRAELNITQE